MDVVILGDRFKKGNKTNGCVGLLPITKRINLIQYQYRVIKQNFPSAKIYYIYGFDNKKFLSFIKTNHLPDMIYVFNERYDSFNEGFSLNLVNKNMSGDTLIIADNYLALYKNFANFNREESRVFIDKTKSSNIGCIINHNVVENIFYDLEEKIYNMFYVSHKDIGILKNELANITSSNMFLFEIFNKCMHNELRIIGTKLPDKSLMKYKFFNKLS